MVLGFIKRSLNRGRRTPAQQVMNRQPVAVRPPVPPRRPRVEDPISNALSAIRSVHPLFAKQLDLHMRRNARNYSIPEWLDLSHTRIVSRRQRGLVQALLLVCGEFDRMWIGNRSCVSWNSLKNRAVSLSEDQIRRAIWIAFQANAAQPVGTRVARSSTETDLHRYRDMRGRYHSFRKQAQIGSCGPTAMSYCAIRLGLPVVSEGVASSMVGRARTSQPRNKRMAMRADYSDSGSHFPDLIAAIDSTPNMRCEGKQNWRVNPQFPTIFRMDWQGAGNRGHFAVAMGLITAPNIMRQLIVVFDPWYGLQYLDPQAANYLTCDGSTGVIDPYGLVVSKARGARTS